MDIGLILMLIIMGGPLIIILLGFLCTLGSQEELEKFRQKYGETILKWDYMKGIGFYLEIPKTTIGAKDERKTILINEVKDFKYWDGFSSLECKDGTKYHLTDTKENYFNAINDDIENSRIKAMYARELSLEEKLMAIDALTDSMKIDTKPKKDASVVGRAIAGGIIAGPAGAVVGALSAVDKNNKNNKNSKE